MPGPYTFQILDDVDFPFDGEQLQLKKGETRDIDNPCTAIRFINAYTEATHQGVLEETTGVLDRLQAECTAMGGGPGGTPQPNPPPTPPDTPDPSSTGSDAAPANQEETAQTLNAPQPPTSTVVESPTRAPGEVDPLPLSKQICTPNDPLPIYDLPQILSAQGVPADALGQAIADILRNEPPANESHPDFALNDRLSSSATADPVIIFSGQFSLTLVDVQFPAFGFPIRLTRMYRSGPAYFGPWGFNWDHNYNLYLRELNGGRVAVWTGALREDVYALSPDGFEPPPGIFCRLELDTSAAGGDRYILTDAAGNRQIFARPVGWPRSDRIPAVRLENRQGDGHDLTYDAEGRLQSVADPAGRFLRFTYGDCALLEAVTDHTGRSWLYVHDSDIEHLIAVTTPPTAEYPQGLTSSYEYDRFRAHPALVHNMVRVLDPDGQTVVENRYGDDPGTDDFGRVVFQNYGGFEAVFAATRLQFAPRDPAAINIPTLRVEVVDPGILRVYTFNPRGDLLDERYRLALDGTFRLVARTYRYDEQGNTILRHEPNGLTLASTYDTGNPDPRARGNVLRMVLQPPPTVVAADREIMRATYEGRHNQIKRLIDEGGSVTTFVYDYEETAVDRGNVIRVELPDVIIPDGTTQHAAERLAYDAHGRVTLRETPAGHQHRFAWFETGPNVGFVSSVTRDTAGAAQSEVFDYDAVGNLIAVTDGLGRRRTYDYDALGRLVRLRQPAVAGSEDECRFFYAANGRVRRQEWPRGAYEDAVIADPYIANEFSYDVLGHLTASVYGVNTAAPRRWEFGKDADNNVVKITDPEGTVTLLKYDERGLTLAQTVADGTPDTAIWRMTYDRNGNRTSVTDPAGLRTNFEYDGFGRLVTVRLPGSPEAERTVVSYEYAPRDDVRAIEIRGVPRPGEPRISLGRVDFEFDARRRPFRRTQDGATNTAFHDRDNRTERLIDPRGNAATFRFDGLDRPILSTDAAGNTVRHHFDAAGNLTSIEEDELDPAGAVRTYRTALDYDARNRLISVIDPLGNVVITEFDGRDLPVAFVTPLGLRVEHRHDLDGNIIRRSAIAATPLTHQWERDTLGRVIRYLDPEGSATAFAYTRQDQIASVTFADRSRWQRSYQPGSASMLERETTAAGTEVNYAYGADGAVRRVAFSPGAGLAPTGDIVLETDGLGRTVRLTQDGLTLERTFDSNSRLLSETYDGQSVTAAYDDLNGTVQVNYPDGMSQRYELDALNRVSRIVLTAEGAAALTGVLSAGDELARYEYQGPVRPARRVARGVETLYQYDGGRRLAAIEHRAGPSLVAATRYACDGSGLRRVVQAEPAPLSSMLHRYDDVLRLIERDDGVAASLPPPVNQQADADAYIAGVNSAGAATRESFALNRGDDRTARSVVGAGAVAETYTSNSLRQITAVSRAGGSNPGSFPFAYDADGNLRRDDRHRYDCNALGQVVEVRNLAGDSLLRLAYDPAGRISRTATPAGTNRRIHFSGRWLQENDDAGNPQRQRSYGIGIDELLVESRGTNAWICQDAVYSVLAAADDDGAVLERYAYRSFGEPSIFAPDGVTPRAASAVGVDPTFGGYPLLGSADLYASRSRLYDPVTGRFLSRDPLLYGDGPSPYVYAAHDPVGFIDPTGRFIFIAIAVGALVGFVIGLLWGVSQGHHGWRLFKDALVGTAIGAGAGATGGVLGEALAGAAGVGTFTTVAGTTVSTTAGLTLTQTVVLTGTASAVEGYTIRSLLAHTYPTVVQPPTGWSTLEDAGFGAASGGLIRGVQWLWRGRNVTRLFQRTNDIEKIVESQRVWGQTEGAVYTSSKESLRGALISNKTRSPGTIVFEGPAFSLFEPHPVDGIFSAIKRMVGQFRTPPGDVLITESSFDAERRVLTVTGASLGPHDPNIPPLLGLFGEQARRGGRLFFDQSITGLLQGGGVLMLGGYRRDPLKDQLPNPAMSSPNASSPK